MSRTIEGRLSAVGLKIVIVVSRFNSFITDRLLEGATDTLLRLGASLDDVTVVKVPGSFEIGVAAKRFVDGKKVDGVVCLGTIIRGDTSHNEYIANETAKSVMTLSLDSGVPISFGVITADDLHQAIERAGSKKGNKGSEAVLSVVETINVLKQI